MHIWGLIYLPWTFHSLPEIFYWWTHYSFQVGQPLGDWCYNLSSTAPFWLLDPLCLLTGQSLGDQCYSHSQTTSKPNKVFQHKKTSKENPVQRSLSPQSNFTREKWCPTTKEFNLRQKVWKPFSNVFCFQAFLTKETRILKLRWQELFTESHFWKDTFDQNAQFLENKPWFGF